MATNFPAAQRPRVNHSSHSSSTSLPNLSQLNVVIRTEETVQDETASICCSRLNRSTAESPAVVAKALVMVTARMLRPASRFLSSARPLAASGRPAFQPTASLPVIVNRRRYATPSGVKEMAVRDALNEALAEELEANDKVFILGEEVAQYNGA